MTNMAPRVGGQPSRCPRRVDAEQVPWIVESELVFLAQPLSCCNIVCVIEREANMLCVVVSGGFPIYEQHVSWAGRQSSLLKLKLRCQS